MFIAVLLILTTIGVASVIWDIRRQKKDDEYISKLLQAWDERKIRLIPDDVLNRGIDKERG